MNMNEEKMAEFLTDKVVDITSCDGVFKSEGVKSGVPDLCLPVARGLYHGLYIEMKRTSGGVVSDEQKFWIEQLREQGYAAVVCRGWKAAAEALENYLSLSK